MKYYIAEIINGTDYIVHQHPHETEQDAWDTIDCFPIDGREYTVFDSLDVNVRVDGLVLGLK